MNFYNPYYYSLPSATKVGLFSKIKWGSILSGASKTLNFANQTIPMVKQITPVMRNARTMFKLLSEFKKSDDIEQVTEENHIDDLDISSVPSKAPAEPTRHISNSPTFFA